MLQQDRPLVYFDEGLDLHYGKSHPDEEDLDEPEKQQYPQQNHKTVEQGVCGKPNKKGSLSDDSESDEEEVEEEDEDERGSEEEEDGDEEEFDDSNLCDDNGSQALSMVHRPTESYHYGDSSNLFYSNDDQPRSIATTPLPSASTLCSGNSSMEIWGEDAADSYSLLSLNASQSRSFNDPMMTSQDENLFYTNTYPNSYMMSTAANDNHQNQVSLGGYMTIEQSNVVSDGFIEDVTLCDKLDKLNDNFVSTDDEVSLSNGTSFTNLVNMVSVCLHFSSFPLINIWRFEIFLRYHGTKKYILINSLRFVTHATLLFPFFHSCLLHSHGIGFFFQLFNLFSPFQNSPVKLGNQSFDDPNGLLAYRRSITDLDTNTVVEEDDFNNDASTTSSLNAVRSPKKRPNPFAQDDFYNLTLSSSPKRLKL